MYTLSTMSNVGYKIYLNIHGYIDKGCNFCYNKSMEKLPNIPDSLDDYAVSDPGLQNRFDAVRIARQAAARNPDGQFEQRQLATMTDIVLDYARREQYLPENPDQT